MGALELLWEIHRISRATSNTENLSCTCKQLLSRMLRQNGQMRRIFLNKNGPMAPRSFYEI